MGISPAPESSVSWRAPPQYSGEEFLSAELCAPRETVKKDLVSKNASRKCWQSFNPLKKITFVLWSCESKKIKTTYICHSPCPSFWVPPVVCNFGFWDGGLHLSPHSATGCCAALDSQPESSRKLLSPHGTDTLPLLFYPGEVIKKRKRKSMKVKTVTICCKRESKTDFETEKVWTLTLGCLHLSIWFRCCFLSISSCYAAINSNQVKLPQTSSCYHNL